MEEENYHEVWLPLIDIYIGGEEEAFKALSRREGDGKKNAIVFPESYRKFLSPSLTSTTYQCPGHKALKYFAENATLKKNSKDRAIFEMDQGLDIIFMVDENYLNKKNIKEQIKNDYSTDPVIMTTNPGERSYWQARNFDVESPKDFILVDSNIINQGIIPGNDELVERIYSSGLESISKNDAEEILERPLFQHQMIKFTGNEQELYGIVTGDFVWNSQNTKINEVLNERVEIVKIPNEKKYKIGEQNLESLIGIKPENTEQFLTVQYGILNPNVEMAFICGSQGSGKTIISYSAAVELILNYNEEIRKQRGVRTNGKRGTIRESFYDQIAIFRPNDHIGGKKRDEGTLPGDLWKKTSNQFGGIISAHDHSDLRFSFDEMLKHPERDSSEYEKRQGDLSYKGAKLPSKNPAVKLYSFADIRGCSFENTLVFVDEAQNFTPKEMKALVSRLSQHSKMIVVGDPEQCDNPDCTEDRNGLTSAIRHFLPYENTFLSTLKKNRRTSSSKRTLSWNS